MSLSDVDLDLLYEQRMNSAVLPLNELIRDAYDRVIHCVDRRGQWKSAALAPVATEHEKIRYPLRFFSVRISKASVQEFFTGEGSPAGQKK